MRVIWIVLIAFTFALLAPGKLNICVFTRRWKFLSLEFLLFHVASLRSWREWVRARNFLRRSCERNPILLATCAAFCTRVRDRSSRGYPLPPATQATTLPPQQIGDVTDVAGIGGKARALYEPPPA